MKEINEMEKKEKVEDLLGAGIIRIAQRPPKNPKEIPKNGPLSLFLMREDYPGLTPAMWNAVAERTGQGFSMVMVVAKQEDLAQILATLRVDKRLRGGVFGIGFKDQAVLQMNDSQVPNEGKLDSLGDTITQVSGAANVFTKNENGEFVGYNTDSLGFLRSLKERMKDLDLGSLDSKKILVLGAGGAGAAISFLLPQEGARVVILNRTVQKAENIAERINKHYEREVAISGGEDLIPEEMSKTDVVVNTSEKGASGSFEDFTAFSPAGGDWTLEKNLQNSETVLKTAKSGLLVCDIVLREKDTPTIAIAKRFGFKTLDGKPMVLYQAIPAIKLVFPILSAVSDSQIEDIMRQAQK